MAEPVITRYGLFTKTKYKIYPISCEYKAKYEIPGEIVKKSMGGQLEHLSVALNCLIYGGIYHIIYCLGIPKLLNVINKNKQ